MPPARDDCTIALLLLIALFLPPVAVLFVTGCDANFFLNVLLSLLFWIPAIIHAVFVILYYGYGGKLSSGEPRRLARRGSGITYATAARPPAHAGGGVILPLSQSRNETVGQSDRVGGYRYGEGARLSDHATGPSDGTVLSIGETLNFTWEFVSNDPAGDEFDIVLWNFQGANPPVNVTLAEDVKITYQRYPVKIPCDAVDGPGYQINAMSGGVIWSQSPVAPGYFSIIGEVGTCA
ncbi:hypothetical protein VPNG_02279 [Cytospora leucostoma]|uniref:Yeast cell wall synthesis Kre9/Knh1-like N-terminal domain-containing protein n=1 Tax=Cytospora leucostoma TaxID=1230097 RepID=A0A423XGP9_9PEZI|nr:hypothetical protein VPNG_02279 [Cytospora leucostoma]